MAYAARERPIEREERPRERSVQRKTCSLTRVEQARSLSAQIVRDLESTSSEGRGRSATPPLPSSPPSSPLEGGATTQLCNCISPRPPIWGVKSSGIFVSCVVCRRKFVYSLSGAGEIQYRRHAHETITIGYTQDARSRKGTDESTASYPQCIEIL